MAAKLISICLGIRTHVMRATERWQRYSMLVARKRDRESERDMNRRQMTDLVDAGLGPILGDRRASCDNEYRDVLGIVPTRTHFMYANGKFRD